MFTSMNQTDVNSTYRELMKGCILADQARHTIHNDVTEPLWLFVWGHTAPFWRRKEPWIPFPSIISGHKKYFGTLLKWVSKRIDKKYPVKFTSTFYLHLELYCRWIKKEKQWLTYLNLSMALQFYIPLCRTCFKVRMCIFHYLSVFSQPLQRSCFLLIR